MTQKELYRRLAEAAGCDIKEAEELLSATVLSLSELCASMDAVAVPGFGTFMPVKKEECVTTNAQTGERVLNPPAIKVKFNPSVLLRKQFEG
ncbi:MAG: HU family DNA-binding protein [Muribaculaceae bacterium]|nr:HU family DNA-binding protein [Muribaculaceae bacterium]